MAKSHGRLHYFSLDNPAGSLVDVSALCDQADYTGSADRPDTTTFGDYAKDYGVLGLRSAEISVSGFFSAATAKVHGRNCGILLGAYDLSAYFDSGTITKNVDLPETQTFGDAWKEHIPGLIDASCSLDGFHDPATNASFDRLDAALAAESGTALSVGYAGFAIGSLVDLGAMATESHSIPGGVNDVTKTSASVKYAQGAFLGVSLHAIGAEVAAANAASVNETAATADGGVAALHVTSVTGAGNATFKVQHSANDSAWSDLGTFTVITAVGSEVITIAAGTTVNQYVRCSLSALDAGITSITFQMSFARRAYASAGSAGALRHWASLVQAAASSTFNLGPRGNTNGYEKFSGECWLSTLATTFSENDVEKFSATLVSESTITKGTF